MKRNATGRHVGGEFGEVRGTLSEVPGSSAGSSGDTYEVPEMEILGT